MCEETKDVIMSSWKEIKRCRGNAAGSKEEKLGSECIMEDRCPLRHLPIDCRIFQLLPVQHRRALAIRKGYCLLCLTHDNRTSCSKNPSSRFTEQWREEHWLMTQQYRPGAPTPAPARLPRIEHVPGRQAYQCHLN